MKEHQKIIHPSRLTDRLWDISCKKDLKHTKVFIPESQQSVRRGEYGTLGSGPQFKTTPLCRVVCELTESCPLLPVHDSTASLYPQLNVFHSARIGLPEANLSMARWENIDILHTVNLTSALATSVEGWMSADVPTWPETFSHDFPAIGKEQKHHSTAPRF